MMPLGRHLNLTDENFLSNFCISVTFWMYGLQCWRFLWTL